MRGPSGFQIEIPAGRDNLKTSMIAAEFEDVQSDSASSFSRWLIPALILSILLHLLFWYWARGFSLPSSGREVYERIVPRTFHLERVEIDSKLLAPDDGSEKQTSLAPESVNLPDEKTRLRETYGGQQGRTGGAEDRPGHPFGKAHGFLNDA